MPAEVGEIAQGGVVVRWVCRRLSMCPVILIELLGGSTS